MLIVEVTHALEIECCIIFKGGILDDLRF
jgi:hypothetical protein